MAREDKKGTLLKLFFSMLYISAFTFGGGFVIITFMKRKFVDELGWIDEQEMLDLTALAQSSPGAIAVNAAILVGWRVGGFLGMVTAVIGTVLPPITILSVISSVSVSLTPISTIYPRPIEPISSPSTFTLACLTLCSTNLMFFS